MRKIAFIVVLVILASSLMSPIVRNLSKSILDEAESNLSSYIVRRINREIVGSIRVEHLDLQFPSGATAIGVRLYDAAHKQVLFAKRAEVTISILSLFLGHLTFPSLLVEDPDVELIYKDGNINIAKVFDSPHPGPSEGVYVSIKHLQMLRGNVSFHNQSGHAVYGYNTSAVGSLLITDKGVSSTVRLLSAQSGRVMALDRVFSFSKLRASDLFVDDNGLRVQRLKSALDDAVVEAKGGLSFKHETLDIDVNAETNPSTFAHYFPKWTVTLPQLSGNVHVGGQFSAPIFEIWSRFKHWEINHLSLEEGDIRSIISLDEWHVLDGAVSFSSGGFTRLQGVYDFNHGKMQFGLDLSSVNASVPLALVQQKLPIGGTFDSKLTISRANSNGPIRAHFLGNTQESAEAYGLQFEDPVHFDVDLDYFPKDRIDITYSKLRSPEFEAGAGGTVALEGGRANVDFSVRLLSTRLVALFVPDQITANQLDVMGNLSNKRSVLHLDAKAELQDALAFGIHSRRINLGFSYQNKRIKIAHLQGDLGGGTIEGSMGIDLSEDDKKVSASLLIHNASVQGIQIPDSRLSRAFGTINAQLSVSGLLEKPVVDGSLSGTGLFVNDFSLGRFDGKVHFEDEVVRFQDLFLNGPIANLTSKRIDLSHQLLAGEVEIHSLELGSLYGGIKGSARGRLVLGGTLLHPRAEASVTVSSVSADKLELGGGSAKLWLDGDQIKVSTQVSTGSSAVELRLAGEWSTQRVQALLKLRDVDLGAFTKAETSPLMPVRASLSGQIALDGTLQSPHMTLDLQTADFYHEEADVKTAKWVSDGPLRIHGQFGNHQVDLDLNGLSSRLNIHVGGFWESWDHYGLVLNGDLNYDGIDKLVRLVHRELVSADLKGSFSGTIDKKNAQQEPQVSGRIEWEGLQLSLPGVPSIHLQKPVSIVVHNNAIDLRNPIELLLVKDKLIIGGQIGREHMDCTVEGRMPLIFSKLLIPIVKSADGTATGRLIIQGSLRKPIINGVITPDVGSSLQTQDTLDPVEFKRGSIRFRPDPEKRYETEIIADKLLIALGEGRAAIDGRVRVSPASSNLPDIDWGLTVKANNVVVRLGQDSVEGDADVSIQTLQNTNWITGKIDVSDGTYVKQFSLRDFSLSTNSGGGIKQAIPSWLSNVAFNTDVRVFSTHFVGEMMAFLLDAYVDGEFTLIGTVDAPRIYGTMNVVEGSLRFPAATFELTRSVIPFKQTTHKTVDPQIDITALGELPQAKFGLTENTVIELKLSGQLDKMQLDLKAISGDKTLDRLRILLLLLGSGVPQTSSTLVQDVRQSANSTILALSGQALFQPLVQELERLMEKFNGSRLRIGTALQEGGVAAQVYWEIGPRLELEGSSAATLNTLRLNDLKLRLLLFDHLTFGSKLFFEGSFLSPNSLSPDDVASGAVKLKYRLLEK